jgi:hypothetical protein
MEKARGERFSMNPSQSLLKPSPNLFFPEKQETP